MYSLNGRAKGGCMKLNYKRTILIGLAFLSICSFWQMYENVIPLILKNTFGFGETITGAIMALDNVLALFLLPLFGAFSDKVDTRFGKRTPFIVIGTMIAVIFMIIIPVADYNQNLILFLVALGFVLIAMGSYRSPAVALMPDLTPKPLRSKANAIINLMGAVGGMYALQMIKRLTPDGDNPNYLPVFLSIAAIMIFAVILLVKTIKEKKLSIEALKEDEEEKPEVKNQSDTAGTKMPKEVYRSFRFILASIFLWFFAYNAVTTAFSRYATEVWGLEGGDYADCLTIAMIAAIISYIPIGFISGKFGRKKTILGGIILITISYFCGFFFLEYSWWINVVFIFTGIGWAAINVNSYPMVVEMSRGADIGKYTGIYYTFSMSSQTLTPIVSGALLQFVSYRTLFPYAFTFSVASFITMLLVRHGDSRPEKRNNALEHFEIED
jgi:MFS family permease